HGLDPVNHHPRLLFDIARNLVGLRINAQPPGQVERVAHHHAVAERRVDAAVRQVDDAPRLALAALAVDGHAAQKQADQQTARQADKERSIVFHFVLRGISSAKSHKQYRARKQAADTQRNRLLTRAALFVWLCGRLFSVLKKQLQTLLRNLDVHARSEREQVLGARAVDIKPAVRHFRRYRDPGIRRDEAARQFVFAIRFVVKLAHQELNVTRTQGASVAAPPSRCPPSNQPPSKSRRRSCDALRSDPRLRSNTASSPPGCNARRARR